MRKRSLFVLTKPQQGAVLVLVFILIFIQCLRYISLVSKDNSIDLAATLSYEKSLDSLLSLAESKSTIVYPFNPNFISAFKAYTLGLSSEEYKRFKEFRSVGKWFNSSDAFQKVTQISDSLLDVVSPQFKFPEFAQKNKFKSVEKTLIKKDINTADAKSLQIISGIGPKLSKRITSYRTLLKGFSTLDQCYEVYGLDSLVVQKIKQHFEIQTPAQIVKLNINQATLSELQQIPYLSLEEAKKIIAYRTKKKTIDLSVLSELFLNSPNKTKRIKLYLY